MDPFGNQPRREGPPTRSRGTWWSRRSQTTRYLIVGSAAVLVVYFVWPYVKGAIGRNGHQPRHTYGDVPPMLDPFGLLRGGEDDYDAGPRRRQRPRGEGNYAAGAWRDPLSRGEGDHAEPLGPRLRLPPGASYGGAGNADGFPRDWQGRPYRWRECTGSPQHPHCGPWRDGPAPRGK